MKEQANTGIVRAVKNRSVEKGDFNTESPETEASVSAICQDDEGNYLATVSTDSPEDTTAYAYGWLDAITAAMTWDSRPDLGQYQLPPTPVKPPSVPTVPPSVRIRLPIICLPPRPAGP